MNPSKIEIFFSSLYPKLILGNPIVATIVFNIGLKLKELKIKIDNTINTDI